jgi:hypothetical protein
LGHACSAERGTAPTQIDEYGESLNGRKVVRQIRMTTTSIILLQQEFYRETIVVLEVGHRLGSVAGAVIRKTGDSA